jgi:hypothetical protein
VPETISVITDQMGDVNRDYKVDLSDYAILSSNYNAGPGKSYNEGDLNFDGYVNLSDYAILSSNYNDSVLPAADFNNDLLVDSEDFGEIVANWLVAVTPGTSGDANADGIVDRDDILVFDSLWVKHVVTRPSPLVKLLADVNSDGGVSATDGTVIQGHFNQSVPANTLGDLNGDEFVDLADYAIYSSQYGESFADATDDGYTDINDFDKVAANLGQSVLGGKADGDFNLDGVVDAIDMAVVGDWWRFIFNETSAHAPSGGSLAVPEPNGFMLPAAVVCSVFCLRSRRST